MQKMKFYVCLAFSGALAALFLTHCTLLPSQSPVASPTVPVTLTPSPSPTSTPTPLLAPQLVALKLWLPDFLDPYAESSGAALLNEQLTAFSEIYPDIQVQVIVKKASGSGGLYGLLSTAYSAAPAVLPDLVVLNRADLQSAIQGAFVQPLELSLSESEYFAFALEGMQVDGLNYGLPFVAYADQMAYRSGVSTRLPFSWTDVLTSGYSLLFPAAPPEGVANDALLAAYLGTGGKIVDEKGSPALERSNLEQLYGFFGALLERSLINSERALALADASACWETYQQGIGRLSPVPAGLYWSAPPPDSAPSWMPAPHGDPITIAHGWSLAMVTTDPFRQQAALQLALWLTAPQQMGDLTRATLSLPPRVQALEKWSLLPEEQAFLNTLLQNAVPDLPPSVDLPVRRALQAGLSALLAREVETPAEAATHALTNLR